MTETNKKASHWGVGLLAGLAAGLAAGLFLQSETGKEMTEDAKKTAKKLQRQLARKLKDVEHLTKDKYEEIVDELIEQYGSAKELAASQMKTLKERLLDQWEDIRAQFQDEEEDED